MAPRSYTATPEPSPLVLELYPHVGRVLIRGRRATFVRLVDCVLDQSGEALHRLQLYVHLGAEEIRVATLGDADGFRGVLVQNDEAVQVVHSVFKLEGLPWKRVPPNTSLERTRGR